MKKILLGLAALGLMTADVAAAQDKQVRENRRGDTVVTTRDSQGRIVKKRVYADGSRTDTRAERGQLRQQSGQRMRQYSYGGRRYNAVRASRWIAPRGWSYRRYAIGVSLPGFFLSTSYYVDPLRYGIRVQRAGPNRRWVRVGNDLYLINIRGRVLQVIPDVFYY